MWSDRDPLMVWVWEDLFGWFFYWELWAVAEGDTHHAGLGGGDGHGVVVAGGAPFLIEDDPLHDVWSACCAFFGFVFEELEGDFGSDGYIDGPEGFVVSVVVEGEGEGLVGGGGVGVGVVGAHIASGGFGECLFGKGAA